MIQSQFPSGLPAYIEPVAFSIVSDESLIAGIRTENQLILDIPESILPVYSDQTEFGLTESPSDKVVLEVKYSVSDYQLQDIPVAYDTTATNLRVTDIEPELCNIVINGPAIFFDGIEQVSVAELIDMSTENVIRVLSEFRKDGLIQIEGKNIEIINIKRLEKIYELG